MSARRRAARSRLQDRRKSVANDALSTLRHMYEGLVAKSGPATLPTGEALSDSEAARLRYGLAARVAEITELDFLELATAQCYRGGNGIAQVVECLPNDERGRAARRAVAAWEATLLSNEGAAQRLVDSLRDPELEPDRQREVCLDGFLEGWRIRVPRRAERPLERSRMPRSAACAEHTGLSFEKLALIERKGGRLALLHVLRSIPDLPGLNSCLALLE